ncbi:MAG: SPFH domain-containing protein, partial [Actinobacteria bacterium]|nr:SPFH domain-containing protein [Actinomycetota bacterium]
MGTFLTTVIVTLIIFPLVLGSILKGAALSSRFLRKNKGAPASQEPQGERARLRGARPWVIGWGIGAAVFLVVALVSSYTQVEAGTVGVVKRLGKVQQTVFEPGFHFKIPFLDQVVLYSTKVTSYEASENPDTSQANYTDYVVDSTTSDGQTVQLTFTVLFRIPAKDAPVIAQEVGDMNAVVENVVKAFSRSLSREVPKGFSAEALYTQQGQADAQDLIQSRLEQAFAQHGVMIDQYLIRRITFAPDYVAAVEAKQIAKQNALTEQNNIAKQEAIKQQTIINAQAEAEKKKIEAEGEAEAIRLK